MTTAQPDISRGRSFNPIWVIPVVALGLGIYMVLHTWLTEGPEITIAFDTAQGLVAGKTKVKYRNVEVGHVTDVELTEDYEGVLARVKMEYQTKPLLKTDTRFWVVTARVSLGNISGLDTLLSGAYIQLAPGSEGADGAREFEALERPPATPADAPGLRLRLLSEHAASVSTGDPILYKGYTVGRVESAEFDTSAERMHYRIFIDAPFDELVDSSVRFWNTSGVELTADAEGVQFRTGSLSTILLGGVAFGRPPDIPPGDPVEPETDFRLYDSYESTLENPYRYGTYFVVRFTQSLKGLVPGAPVEYRGIRIGRVDRILLREMITRGLDMQEQTGDLPKHGRPIPVLIYLEPGRMSLPDAPTGIDLLQAVVTSGVPHGLRATLETGNLLTGAKYIGIDYFKDVEEVAQPGSWGEYEEIPTIAGGFDQIMVKINAILDQVNKAPLEATVANANAALAELEKALEGLDAIVNDPATRQVPANLDATLQELRRSLEGLSPDSELYQNLNGSLRQLNRTMSNLEDLTSTLSGQPNAAVFGSKLPPDPEPEARGP